MKKYERFALAKCPKGLQREVLDYLGVNWKPKHYITSPHCKVCQSPARAEIEELLYTGAPYDLISTWLKHTGQSPISPTQISKHKKAHCNFEKEVEERGLARYVSQVRRTEAQQLAKLSGGDVLQGIIEAFADHYDPEEQPIKPRDAIQAVKVQHEIEGGQDRRDPILRLYEQLEKKNLRMIVEPADVCEGEVEEGDVVEDEGQEETRPEVLPGP